VQVYFNRKSYSSCRHKCHIYAISSLFCMAFIYFSSTCYKNTLCKFVLIVHDILTLEHKYVSKVFYNECARYQTYSCFSVFIFSIAGLHFTFLRLCELYHCGNMQNKVVTCFQPIGVIPHSTFCIPQFRILLTTLTYLAEIMFMACMFFSELGYILTDKSNFFNNIP